MPELEPGVVTHAVLVRVKARKDVGVGRERDHVMGVRIREDDAACRQAIEKRRLHTRVAGEAERVGAERVNRDQDDVRRLAVAAENEEASGHSRDDHDDGGENTQHPAREAR